MLLLTLQIIALEFFCKSEICYLYADPSSSSSLLGVLWKRIKHIIGLEISMKYAILVKEIESQKYLVEYLLYHVLFKTWAATRSAKLLSQ